MKHMSHFGAIRVPKAVPASWIAWRDVDNGDVYMDPMDSDTLQSSNGVGHKAVSPLDLTIRRRWATMLKRFLVISG